MNTPTAPAPEVAASPKTSPGFIGRYAKYFIQGIFAILVAIIAGIFGVFAASKSPPDSVPVISTPSPPDENPQDFVLIKDISIFNLTDVVPGGNTVPKKKNPAYFTDYILVKKKHKVDKYVFHFGTSGHSIDVRCLTHDAKVYVRTPGESHFDKSSKEYVLEVNVSKVPIDSVFTILTQATYWDGFRNKKSENASTYTGPDLSQNTELSLIVVFPEKKPFKNFRLFTEPNDAVIKKESISLPVSKDNGNTRIAWNITDPSPDSHFEIQWDW
jgi:hypothetical protein